MSREKQIEEIANDYYEIMLKAAKSFGTMSQGVSKFYARHLYEKGYRKQSEGAWIWTENGTEDYEQYWLCSCCNNKSYWKSKFCEECGARMKGGS